MFTQYNDVIQWLEKKTVTEPEKTEQIVNSNIDMVSSAFGKPRAYINNLVNKNSFEGISKEEEKILNFYFKLFRKWMV